MKFEINNYWVQWLRFYGRKHVNIYCEQNKINTHTMAFIELLGLFDVLAPLKHLLVPTILGAQGNKFTTKRSHYIELRKLLLIVVENFISLFSCLWNDTCPGENTVTDNGEQTIWVSRVAQCMEF